MDEGQSFVAFFLTNFDSTFSFKRYLPDNSSGSNSIQTESHQPVRVVITFGKTFVKFFASTGVMDPVELSIKSMLLIWKVQEG